MCVCVYVCVHACVQARTAAAAGGGSDRPVGYDPSCGNNCIRCHGTDSPWLRDSLHSGNTLFAGGSQSVQNAVLVVCGARRLER